MTISELIKLLLEQDIGDIADTMRHAEYNKYIQGIMHKQRDTIRRLREDERRTACIIDALCRKIDEYAGAGKGNEYLHFLNYANGFTPAECLERAGIIRGENDENQSQDR